MVIVFGERTSYDCVGFVADYCAICRGLAPVALIESTTAQHVYYITVSRSTPSKSGVCVTCGVPVEIDPKRYKAVVKEPESLEALVEESFPTAKEVHAKHLAIDSALASNPSLLSPEDRRGVVVQALRSLGCYWRELFPTSGPRARSFISALPYLLVVGILGFGVVMGFAGSKRSGLLELGLRYSLAGWMLLGCIFWFISWWIDKRRWTVLHILPRLKSCLSAVKPSVTEFELSLAEVGRAIPDFARQLSPAECAAVTGRGSLPADPWPVPMFGPAEAMVFCAMMFGLTIAYLMIFNE